MRPLRTAGLTLVMLLAPACSDPPAAGPCGPVVEEDLDPDHLTHLLDPDGGTFLTDPPTSGPHWVGPLPEGTLDEPIPPAVQVSILEQGKVLIQHRDLEAGERDAVHGLVTDRVVAAPNPTLEDRVVATAWTTKLSCDGVDADALTAFVSDHADQVDGH